MLILLRILTIPYVYAVLMITLIGRTPTYSHNIKPPFWEIAELMNGNKKLLFDIIANLIMLFPLGIFLPLFIKKADNLKKIALAGLVISFFIEITQLITTRGFFEIDDIVHNTLGMIFGGVIGCPLAKLLYPRNNEKKNNFLLY